MATTMKDWEQEHTHMLQAVEHMMQAVRTATLRMMAAGQENTALTQGHEYEFYRRVRLAAASLQEISAAFQ